MQIIIEEGKSFLRSTSIKGVSRIFKARWKGLRLLWIVGVLSLAAFCGLFTTNLIQLYVSYPKTTQVYATSVSKPEGKSIMAEFFPSVTICNTYPFQSRLPNGSSEALKDSLKNAHNLSSFYSDYFYSVGIDVAKQLGHRAENLIPYCRGVTQSAIKFSPWNCFDPHAVDIELILNPTFFNCYMLSVNRSKMDTNILNMEMVLFLDDFERETTTNLENSSPNTLMVNLGKKEAIQVDDIVTAIPGQIANVEVSFSYVKNLPEPHGKCVQNSNTVKIWTLDGKPMKFSVQGCQMAAMQTDFFTQCSCILDGVPVFGHENKNETHFVRCNMDYIKTSNTNCVNVLNNLNYDAECPETCENIMYHKDVAFLPWENNNDPSSFYDKYIHGKSFEDRFKPFYTKNRSDETKLLKLRDLITSQFAFVKITFKMDSIIVYKDVPQFSFTSFISSLGGILNLYSGISFVIVIEVMDFIVSLLRRCLKSEEILPK